jgi:renalase
MSTRRSDHGDFDHGAQYFTSRTPDFTALVNQLVKNGDVAPWHPNGKDSPGPGGSASLACPPSARRSPVISTSGSKPGTRIRRIDGGYSVDIESRQRPQT